MSQMKKIKVKAVTDWCDIDIQFNEDCTDYTDNEQCVQGIYVDNEFINLDIFARYNTSWTGSAPEAIDEYGNDVSIHGVSTDLSYPYLVEINDSTQQLRLWKETEAWYS